MLFLQQRARVPVFNRLSRSRSFFISISPRYKGLNRWWGAGVVGWLRPRRYVTHRSCQAGHRCVATPRALLNASYTRMRLVSCSTSPRRASFSHSLLEHNGSFPLFPAREERSSSGPLTNPVPSLFNGSQRLFSNAVIREICSFNESLSTRAFSRCCWTERRFCLELDRWPMRYESGIERTERLSCFVEFDVQLARNSFLAKRVAFSSFLLSSLSFE